MDLPFDDVLKNGFCWGEYPAGIDDTGRLRLPKAIVDVLAEHRVSKLWRSPDPRAKRFVLCPPDYRVTFITTAQSNFQEPEDADRAWRLVCSGTDARIDSQGRISIPQVCLEQANIEPPQQVKILGVGFWYEVKVSAPMTGRS
jgi:DNA-binding transcriptional regulator/RsmH inhibitor MraZ